MTSSMTSTLSTTAAANMTDATDVTSVFTSLSTGSSMNVTSIRTEGGIDNSKYIPDPASMCVRLI